jgi:hypothetical protein
MTKEERLEALREIDAMNERAERGAMNAPWRLCKFE